MNTLSYLVYGATREYPRGRCPKAPVALDTLEVRVTRYLLISIPQSVECLIHLSTITMVVGYSLELLKVFLVTNFWYSVLPKGLPFPGGGGTSHVLLFLTDSLTRPTNLLEICDGPGPVVSGLLSRLPRLQGPLFPVGAVRSVPGVGSFLVFRTPPTHTTECGH